MTPEEREKMMAALQIPPESTIPDRLMKIIQYTSLSYCDLLRKRLVWKEPLFQNTKPFSFLKFIGLNGSILLYEATYEN
jgi:hypothetical protein